VNRKAVAQELVKVAKSLTADYGDVRVYLNVSDFFKTTSGEKMTSEQVEMAERWLENSALACQMDFEKAVKAAIVKRYSRQLDLVGFLEVK
jgi:hypothetical protein